MSAEFAYEKEDNWCHRFRFREVGKEHTITIQIHPDFIEYLYALKDEHGTTVEEKREAMVVLPPKVSLHSVSRSSDGTR